MYSCSSPFCIQLVHVPRLGYNREHGKLLLVELHSYPVHPDRWYRSGPHSLGSRSAVISRYWQGSNPALLATMNAKSSNSAPGKHGLEIKTARHQQGNTDKIDYYLAKQLLQASESPSQKKRASPSPVITRRMNIITSSLKKRCTLYIF